MYVCKYVCTYLYVADTMSSVFMRMYVCMYV